MEATKLEDSDSPIKALLAATLLFKDADVNVIDAIAALLKKVTLKISEPVFLENEISKHVYFVEMGSVEIVRYSSQMKRIRRITVLSEGAHFSELSVLTSSNHSTSAFALEETVLWKLDRKAFDDVLTSYPHVSKSIVLNLAELNFKMTESSQYVEPVSEEQFEQNPAMPRLLPWKMIDRYQVLPVSIYGRTLTVAMVNTQDKEFVKSFRSQHKEINLKIESITPPVFQKLSHGIRQEYERGSAVKKVAPPSKVPKKITGEALAALLAKTKFFTSLPKDYIHQLLPHLKIMEFKKGQAIFNPESPESYLYVIYMGSVEFTKPASDGSSTAITTFHEGDSFGEIAIILDSKHTLAAHAGEDTVIACLEGKLFHQLLGSPLFSLPVAKVLARRLQNMNRMSNVEYYTGPKEIDFSEMGNYVPKETLVDTNMIPLSLVNNEMTIGCVDPDNDIIYIVINRYLSKFRIKVRAITQLDFNRWITQIEAVEVIIEDSVMDTSANFDGEPTEIVSQLFARGIGLRASDIHLQPQDGAHMVRFRVDGQLVAHHQNLGEDKADGVINRIKILSEMDISEKRLPQDGHLKLESHGLTMEARVSTIPTKFGEKIVMRIVKSQQALVPLNMLAPDKYTVGLMQDFISYSQGLVLVTGPTGSGKTTTLYSMLNVLNTSDRNIITVEDPIEAVIPGVTQIEVKDDIGLSFDKVLRHVLRQDPDIILAGEIRDKESAQVAFQAALTGHLVLSTIHTNNSLDVASRIQEFGISPNVFSNAMIGVIAQRLIRAVCKHCRKTRIPEGLEKMRIAEALGSDSIPDAVNEATGCTACHNTGYLGRIPIIELWRNDRNTAKILLAQEPVENLRREVTRSGFQSLYQFGIKMVVAGLTTFEEVDRYLSTTR
jgi:type IV pilus assembly protein PilB